MILHSCSSVSLTLVVHKTEQLFGFESRAQLRHRDKQESFSFFLVCQTIYSATNSNYLMRFIKPDQPTHTLPHLCSLVVAWYNKCIFCLNVLPGNDKSKQHWTPNSDGETLCEYGPGPNYCTLHAGKKMHGCKWGNEAVFIKWNSLYTPRLEQDKD